MDVFDSNIWITGFTGKSADAIQLINEVRQNQRSVGVDAYIFEEVIQAFDNSGNPQKHNLKTAFAQFVNNHQMVDGPTQNAVSGMNLTRTRNQPEVMVIADVCSIQTKDAPVLCLAYQINEIHQNSPIIYTHDRPFSNMNPNQHNLSQISLQHIPP